MAIARENCRFYVSHHSGSRRCPGAVSCMRQDEPRSLRGVGFEESMWIVPHAVVATPYPGRNIRCDDVRPRNSVIRVACARRLLGTLVRSVPDDGARARQGGCRRAGRVACRESELRYGTRARRAIPNPLHSNARDLPGWT